MLINYALTGYSFALLGRVGETKTLGDLGEAIEKSYSQENSTNKSVVEACKANSETEIVRLPTNYWKLKETKS